MRTARTAALLLLLGLALGTSACSRPDRTPEGAVQLFRRAAYEGNVAAAYQLLSSSSRRELEERARLANAQAGAARPLKPEDLLALGREPSSREAPQVRVLDVQGDHARVELVVGGKGTVQGAVVTPQREVLELIREGGAWRIVLPKPPPEPAAPASRPASQPASRPTPPASAPAPAPAPAP